MDILALPNSEDPGSLLLRVVFDGAAAPGAVVVVRTEGSEAKLELVADDDGHVRVPLPKHGPLEVRALVKERLAAFEYRGSTLEEVRHYATLAIADPSGVDLPEGADLLAWQRLCRALALERVWDREDLGWQARVTARCGSEQAAWNLEVGSDGAIRSEPAGGGETPGSSPLRLGLEVRCGDGIGALAQIAYGRCLAPLTRLRVTEGESHGAMCELLIGKQGEHRVRLVDDRIQSASLAGLTLVDGRLEVQAGHAEIEWFRPGGGAQEYLALSVLAFGEQGQALSQTNERLSFDERDGLPAIRVFRRTRLDLVSGQREESHLEFQRFEWRTSTAADR